MIDTTPSSRTIERLAVHYGFVSAEERAALSRDAAATGRDFGEHCLRAGRITDAQLETLVRRAAELDRKSGRLHLGGIAVELGYMSPDTLDRALRRQRKLAARDRIEARLGELLLVRGELSLGQLEKVLSVQGTRRLRCPSCAKALEINRLGTKQPRCPGCGAGLVTPALPPRAETIARAERLRRAMLTTFDRARIVRDASVAADVQLADEALHDSAGMEVVAPPALNTIDLDATPVAEQPAADALGAARSAFRTFHETTRTARPDADDGVDEGDEAQPAPERVSAAPSVAVRADTTRRAATRRSRIDRRPPRLVSKTTVRRLATAAVVLVALSSVGAVAFYQECQRDQQAHREAIEAATLQPVAPPVQDPVPSLAEGCRVEIVGVIRGGAGALDAGHCGARLVVRGYGDLWIADTSAQSRELFAVLADRHAQQQRTALRVTGTVRRGGARDGSTGPWVQVDPDAIAIIRYAECADCEVGLVRLSADQR